MSKKRYPARQIRTVPGIRAQLPQALFRSTWWARRWLASMEALRLGARLGRGRLYALSGQVASLTVEGPRVFAKVAGSRPEPYSVELGFTVPPAQGIARISRKLKSRPALLARLLTGDFPLEVVELFAKEGCPVFPVAGGGEPYDVRMRCSCPDWRKPCKHVVAVLFLLGEEIVFRPALLLALRGIDLDGILPPADSDSGGFAPVPPETSGGFPAPSAAGDAAGQAMLRRLGPVPFWRGFCKCEDSLARFYAHRAHWLAGRVAP